MKYSFVIFAVFALSSTNLSAQYFSKDSIKNAGGGTVTCKGVAWVDFDSDGDDDLFLAGDTCRMFQNNGNGNFSEIAIPSIQDLGPASGSAWADYDNDTLPDVYLFDYVPGINRLFHNEGNGVFTLQVDQVNETGNVWSASWVDINNDGFTDLYVSVHHTLNKNLFYFNNGNGRFSLQDSSGTYQFILPLNPPKILRRTASFSDFNNDGFPDVHICGWKGINAGDGLYNYFFLNNQGAFISANNNLITTVIDVKSSAWGDYNNDGLQDLFIASQYGASLCTNQGNSILSDTSPEINSKISSSDNPLWFDFDNDGYLDLFATNLTLTDSLHLLKNIQTGSFSKIKGEPLTDFQRGAMGAGASDFDNDGDVDIFLPCNSKNYLYKNNGNANHWLKIRLYGTVSNYCGIGAKIKIKVNNFWQMREVLANSIPSQSSLTQVFGLGNATEVDSIRIFWSSGNVLEIGTTVADQYLKIRESSVNFKHATPCGTLNAVFYNTSPTEGPYFWDFGDGMIDSTNDTVSFSHSYSASGHYLVKLTDQTGKSIRKDSIFIDNSTEQQASLSGPLVVPNNTNSVEYSIPYKYGSIYKWRVVGGTQAGGDSSNKILVDWGDAGKGFIRVEETLINKCPGRFASDSVTLLENQFKAGTAVFPNEALRTSTCHWIDIDNDGFVDLYVTNENGPAAFYKYNGSFFTNVTSTPIVQYVNSVTNCVWGDYNNDGFIDVFFTRKSGQNNLLFKNLGNNEFVEILTGSVVNDGGDSFGATWGDYNRDGLIDIFVANQNGNSFLYKNNGDDNFIRITNATPVLNPMQAIDAQWIDFDNNNTLDLFITRLNEKNLFFKNNGDTTFELLNPSPFDSVSSYSYGASWSDYDNDGDMDLFIPNNFGNNNFLYENNGEGNFTMITLGEIVNDGGFSTSSSWGDFDNDGDEDLFVANEGSSNFMYKNNGNKTFLKITNEITVLDQSSSLAGAWFDFDRTGTLDLYVANDGNDLFYKTTDFGANWIGIICKGVISNASALGTKIYVKAKTGTGDVWQMRVISDHSGHGNQNGLIQHFGLGSDSICDSIKINWHSGRVQYLTGISANQIITVTESNLPVLRGKKVCAGSFVSLKAEGELIKWYDSSTSVSPFSTVSNYTTPLLNDSVTYYVTNTVLGLESERLPVTVAVLPKPKANFTTSDTALILPSASIQFTDNSIGANFWRWDFGDGDTSLKQNPIHLYSQQGYYSVKLVVGNSLCPSDSMVKTNLIHITSSIFEDVVDKNSLTITPFYEQKSIFAGWNTPPGHSNTKPITIFYQIIGLTGQKVMEGKINNNSMITLINIQDGIYIIKLNIKREDGKILFVNRKLVWY